MLKGRDVKKEQLIRQVSKKCKSRFISQFKPLLQMGEQSDFHLKNANKMDTGPPKKWQLEEENQL